MKGCHEAVRVGLPMVTDFIYEIYSMQSFMCQFILFPVNNSTLYHQDEIMSLFNVSLCLAILRQILKAIVRQDLGCWYFCFDH